MIEKQDLDRLNQELKESEEVLIYADLLADLEQALEKCICQANKDEISNDDILNAFERSFENCQNIKIKIERV